jgi:hypothetical protein
VVPPSTCFRDRCSPELVHNETENLSSNSIAQAQVTLCLRLGSMGRMNGFVYEITELKVPKLCLAGCCKGRTNSHKAIIPVGSRSKNTMCGVDVCSPCS